MEGLQMAESEGFEDFGEQVLRKADMAHLIGQMVTVRKPIKEGDRLVRVEKYTMEATEFFDEDRLNVLCNGPHAWNSFLNFFNMEPDDPEYSQTLEATQGAISRFMKPQE